MTEQAIREKIEKDLEEFEQRQCCEFEEKDLSGEYEKFVKKFDDNPDIDKQEIDDQWEDEKARLEENFKEKLKILLEDEEKRLEEYYSEDLD